MGKEKLALLVVIGSSLAACGPASPPDLTPTPPILPSPGSDNPLINPDLTKVPQLKPTEHSSAFPAPSPTDKPPESTKTPTPLPTPQTESRPTLSPETTATKEVEQPVTIWFLGSSTMKNFELIADYIQKLFPGPKFRFSIGGRPGAQIEDLTNAVRDNTLNPIIDNQPLNPAGLNFIVLYGGANDLFAEESIVSMENETDDLFTALAGKYPNAKFIYVKPYHLSGIYTSKNPGINDFNRSFSAEHIISEVKKRTGRTINIATVDINEDLDKCDPKLIQCFLDDRHAGPPILEDIIDKTKEIIDPPQSPEPKSTPPIHLLPFATLWQFQEGKRKRPGFRGQENKN